MRGRDQKRKEGEYEKGKRAGRMAGESGRKKIRNGDEEQGQGMTRRKK